MLAGESLDGARIVEALAGGPIRAGEILRLDGKRAYASTFTTWVGIAVHDAQEDAPVHVVYSGTVAAIARLTSCLVPRGAVRWNGREGIVPVGRFMHSVFYAGNIATVPGTVAIVIAPPMPGDPRWNALERLQRARAA